MKKIFALLSVLLTAACFGGMTQPSKFYSLSSAAGAAETFKSARLMIGVEEVKVPVYLDKPQIVTRDDNQVELTVSEFNRWSEPLSSAMQRAIADDMAACLPDATVKPSSFRREGFDYTVWVEVNKFDGSWGKSADLSVWWSIFDRNGSVVLQERADLSRPLGHSYDDLAVQDSDLVNELSRLIAAKVAKLKK